MSGSNKKKREREEDAGSEKAAPETPRIPKDISAIKVISRRRTIIRFYDAFTHRCSEQNETPRIVRKDATRKERALTCTCRAAKLTIFVEEKTQGTQEEAEGAE